LFTQQKSTHSVNTFTEQILKKLHLEGIRGHQVQPSYFKDDETITREVTKLAQDANTSKLQIKNQH